jgi:hypothetical protein
MRTKISHRYNLAIIALVGLINASVSGCYFGPSPDDARLLHKSIQDGRTDVLARLLNEGMSPNYCDGQMGCALGYAAALGNETAVRMLLNAGADLENRTSEGSTALVYSIVTHQCNSALILLESGASPEAIFYNAAPMAMREAYNKANAKEVYELSKSECLPCWNERKKCWSSVEELLNK